MDRPSYTFISARYANAEHTAAAVMTEEAAMVMISAADTPELWEALHKWGDPAPYAAPAPPPPAQLPAAAGPIVFPAD